MFKPITKEANRKKILLYYAASIIFIGIGLFTKQSSWYYTGAALLGIGLFRKYWLHKRLKE